MLLTLKRYSYILRIRTNTLSYNSQDSREISRSKLEDSLLHYFLKKNALKYVNKYNMMDCELQRAQYSMDTDDNTVSCETLFVQ